MRRDLRLVGVVVVTVTTLLLGGCSSSSTAGAKVDPVAFLTEVSSPEVIVLDVRTPEEFAAGHLAGARNIDVEGAGFAAQVATLDPTATYAVYCRSGRRSAVAAATLTELGFTHVIDLDGGLVDLQAAGAAVVTS